jgi:hypothetical protein
LPIRSILTPVWGVNLGPIVLDTVSGKSSIRDGGTLPRLSCLVEHMDEPVDADLVEPRDGSSLTEAADAARRETIRCTLVAYRRPDRLEVGGPVPELELTVLNERDEPSSETVDIAAEYDCP